MSHAQPPFPAPPPPAPEPQVTQPAPWVWVFVVAAAVGVVGGVLPWFQPTVDGHHIPGASQVHSWNDGRIGIVGPVLMLIAGIRWLMVLTGRSASRRRTLANPLRWLSGYSLLWGAVTLVLLAIAWALVPHNYRDWDSAQAEAHQLGMSLGRGPLIGYWLVAMAGVAFVVLGAAGLAQFRKPASPATPDYPAPQPYPQGYPQSGYQPAEQQPPGYQPPQSYDASRPVD